MSEAQVMEQLSKWYKCLQIGVLNAL
jgi:hypothetical protein